jgi:hypothetical protein
MTTDLRYTQSTIRILLPTLHVLYLTDRAWAALEAFYVMF